MIPLLLTFADNISVYIFVTDAVDFLDTVDKSGTPTIQKIEEVDDKKAPSGNILECSLTLRDGNMLICSMLHEDITTIETRCTQVLRCEEVFTTEVSALVVAETILDNRMGAVRQVINNIPDKQRRLNLQKQYIKRKTAYIAALEALIHGAFRD